MTDAAGTAVADAPNTTTDGTQTPEVKPNAGETVDVAALQAENARLQREAESARVKAKGAVASAAQRDQLFKVAEALGIELPKGEEQTVETLQAALTEEANKNSGKDAENLTLKQARAVDKAAWTNGIDPAKSAYLEFLLGSNPVLATLDPAAADYQTSVNELVKTITAADPIFAATPGGAKRSGTEGPSGAGTPGEVTRADFEKMGVMEKTKLYQTNPELFNRLQAG